MNMKRKIYYCIPKDLEPGRYKCNLKITNSRKRYLIVNLQRVRKDKDNER